MELLFKILNVVWGGGEYLYFKNKYDYAPAFDTLK